jgi:ADP-ribose pyrophosphatase YjhB (NUDIX family)
MLGVQYIVFSPLENYLLIGERSLTQEYYPGRITVPGGMLELSDIYLSPKTALLRELKEEVPLNISTKANLISIVGGWNGVSITFMIKTKLSKDCNFNPSEIIMGEKNEWKSGLKWIPISELKNLPNNQLLDGLVYFKSKTQL